MEEEEGRRAPSPSSPPSSLWPRMVAVAVTTRRGSWKEGLFARPLQHWLFLALEFGLVVGFSFLTCYLFILPYCGALFRCGCSWVWSGGLERCNIHSPHGPHCPWCAASSALIWLPQYGTSLAMTLVGLLTLLFCRWKAAAAVRPKQGAPPLPLHLQETEPLLNASASAAFPSCHNKAATIDQHSSLVVRTKAEWWLPLFLMTATFFLFGLLLALVWQRATHYPHPMP
ncbi:Transmembrane protein [Balamuthia mandrillaris]